MLLIYRWYEGFLMAPMNSLRTQLRRQTNVEVNARLEWVWWWARWFLAVAGLVGGAIVFSGTEQMRFVYINSAAFLVVNLGILWLLRRARMRQAFLTGFVIDTWVVVANWWTVLHIPDKGEKPSDLYLILFPFFIAVVVRVGPWLGTAYAAVLTALMVAGDLRYQGAGSYAVSQLPTRVLFLVLTTGMTAMLVARLRAGRESLRDAYSDLAAKEERFRLLFESAPVGIALSDNERRFVEVNQALADLLGVSVDSFRGKRVADFEAESNTLLANGPFERLASGSADLVVGERRLRVRGGGMVWVNVVSAAVRGADGGLEYMIRIFEDITERKQMEQAKDEFLAMTSHELKSPITSILATFKLLASGTMGSLPVGADELLSGAEQNAERLASMVSEILDLQGMTLGADPLSLAECDALQLAEEAARLLDPTATAATVEVRVSGDPVSVFCDGERIEQVLTNLISNAIKFAPAGSIVDVEVGREAGGIEFAVKDSGRGIATEQRDLVFEKFWQADASDSRERQGSGLGLAIAKAIVLNHKGLIWVESVLGEGATFRFVLPVRRETNAA
jgi:PAS domain S-box-containing protein